MFTAETSFRAYGEVDKNVRMGTFCGHHGAHYETEKTPTAPARSTPPGLRCPMGDRRQMSKNPGRSIAAPNSFYMTAR
jgi:hypothetical protein